MRKAIILLVLASLLGLIGCGGSSTSSNANAVSPNAKRYPFKGKVVSVDRAKKTASIDHEAIEGYMGAMTMDFPIHADWAWESLKPGAEISGELVVDNTAKEPYFLENIVVVSPPDPNAPAPNTNFAQIGQPAPDFSLTNQDDKKISLKTFEGKAFAITFIYAKCPLPEFCIKMSANFRDAARLIQADPVLRDKLRLLSISFDPENDTPEKLRAYGITYMGNDPNAAFDVWQLAVGSDAEVKKIADFYGLRYEVDPNNKAIFNHSLRTAVISPDGKVTKIFAGNDWTPTQLVDALKASL